MIVVLNGSPNREGFTTKVINEHFKDYTEFVAYEFDVKPCDDCKYCNYQTGCKWNDMEVLFDALQSCEHLVIASPLYFGALSSELLRVITRFQTFFSQKYHRELPLFTIPKTTLIVTAGGDYPNMFEGVRATMKVLNMLFSVEEYNEILINNTDQE